METNGILKWFFVLLFTLVLSCTDHLPPQNLRIKSITQTLPNSNGVANITEFNYDNAGRLSYLKSYQTPDSNAAVRATTIYTFDGNNMLLAVTRNFSDLKTEKYQFTYNQAGQINKLDYMATADDVYNMTFEYNGNLLAGSKRKFSFSSVSFDKSIIYNFSNDNLGSASSITTFTKNVSSVTNSVSTYTYDDKINPFYGNFIIPAPNGPARPSQGNFNYYTYYGGIDNFLSLNRNNIVSESIAENYNATYEYTYNIQGLPLSRITRKKNGPQDAGFVDETLVFVYETY
ncbi:hypothetical protein [Dyadobacter frigoris]|uniref:DUF4595 domain-containing protein n=1 Tax=Dyadobacter frigoris TaxID=2576211 RepID=A0A4V6BIR2_9BACT|nr:hypothetical protein [Dyadobacter frigoris]TKT89313.1 hypothetical protein FDK13_23450 [Dyadobacter frigoris]GLU57092.1 hypothetical protein Dfri01_65530 [Dyadobacter frigoris]